jgi:thiamine-phosphate pyrophosphorylase
LRKLFERPGVCLVTRGEATQANFAEKRLEILDAVRAAVDAGLAFVQLREKQLTARLVYELASDAAALTRGSATRMLVNDRADIALAAGCDGVQLTSTSLNAGVVRAAFGTEFVIGVSTHSAQEVAAAREAGADFALFGPVFATPGKDAVKGLDELARVCRDAAPFPVIAIGGIDAGNFASVIDAGAAGFAAIRFLNDAERPGGLAGMFGITDN